MSQQHRYTASETFTRNVARVDRLTILPSHAEPQVEILYILGEESAGVFTERAKVSTNIKYIDLPVAVVAVLDNLEAKALNYGENQSILPAGSVEPIP